MLPILFVIVDCGQALVMDFAENRSWNKSKPGSKQYARMTLLVCESLVSIVFGSLVALRLGGPAVLYQCADPEIWLQFFRVAFFFGLGISLKMMAVNHFQAGTIKVIGQLRIPMLALLSWMILSHTYSLMQWQVIALLTTSAYIFVQLKGQVREQEGKSWKWRGLGQLLAWVVLNSVGAVYAERTYKSGDVPFYVKKLVQDVGHLIVAGVMLLIVARCDKRENIFNAKHRPGGFFDSWDYKTWVAVFFLFLDAWVSNRLLKDFSAFTRCILKVVSVALTYFVSMTYAKDRRKYPSLTAAAVLIMQSSLLWYTLG